MQSFILPLTHMSANRSIIRGSTSGTTFQPRCIYSTLRWTAEFGSSFSPPVAPYMEFPNTFRSTRRRPVNRSIRMEPRSFSSNTHSMLTIVPTRCGPCVSPTSMLLEPTRGVKSAKSTRPKLTLFPYCSRPPQRGTQETNSSETTREECADLQVSIIQAKTAPAFTRLCARE